MVNWADSYTSRWRLMKVDQKSWGNTEEVRGMTAVKIDRDCTDDVPLLESAAISCDFPVDQDFEEGWYRVELITQQNEQEERFSLATLLLQSSSGTVDRGYKNVSIDGYSVLKPCSERLLVAGRYAPSGMSAVDFVVQLLQESTPAPVETVGDFRINDPYVFPIGTSYLEAIWTILNAGNFVIQITGEGIIQIMPLPTEPEFDISVATSDMILPGFDYELDLGDVPNRYFAYYLYGAAMEVNDQEGSRTSVSARGRYVDYVDTDPIMVNGESIETYARRKLSELSTVYKKYSYRREYLPTVLPFSLLNCTLPISGMIGEYRVLGQTLNCEHGVTVTEKVGLEIEEYRIT